MPALRLLSLLTLTLALACGESTPMTDTDAGGGVDAGGGETDSGPGEDAGGEVDAGPETLELVGGEWAMRAGEEGYVCVRKTIDRTMFVHEFRPVAPLGTHHTVVTLVPGAAPETDGVSDCEAFTNGPDMIYGSGVGTETLTFPEGVAIRIDAGTQVLLNLHLFNATEADITGRSAIDVTLLDEADVEHEAQVVLAGEEGFRIPARSTDHEVLGECTMRGETTVFAVMPHMHTFGTFMEVRTSGSTETILHEDFYSFDEQRYTTFDPLTLVEDDTIHVRCMYDNPSDRAVRWGDSTLSEMCYAAVYRYPALPTTGGITCTN